MIKAYGYLRVSSQSQIDKNGFDRQEEKILAFAKKSKIEVVKIFKEQVSGVKNSDERDVFQQMIAEILRNGVRTIILERLDRLARQFVVQEQLLIYLVSKGITLLDAATGENVTDAISSDPMKKALIQMQGIFAELEKNLLVKKLRIAREAKRDATGKCEGKKGWNDAPDNRDALVKLIKQYRRKYKGKRRMTYVAVADALNERVLTDDNTFTTITGTKWTGQMIQSFMQRYGK